VRTRLFQILVDESDALRRRCFQFSRQKNKVTGISIQSSTALKKMAFPFNLRFGRNRQKTSFSHFDEKYSLNDGLQ
jgi:hypothetical protein